MRVEKFETFERMVPAGFRPGPALRFPAFIEHPCFVITTTDRCHQIPWRRMRQGSRVQSVIDFSMRGQKWTKQPRAGKRYFGLSRNAAYDAAARGDIPVIRIGRLLRVPVRALERMLDRVGEPAA